MVLIQTSPTRWIAFNPKTCSIQKIWDGEVEWRGKVFDFSQDNSRAKGKTLFDMPARIADLGRGDWKLEGGKIEKGVVTFQSDTASIATPPLASSDYRNIYVAFDETSKAAPFRVEVVDSGTVTEWFDSATHGSSDTDFQWNYKEIWPEHDGAVVRFTSPKMSAKKLRNARVFGDYDCWTSTAGKVELDWRGYRLIDGTVELRYNVVSPKSRLSVLQTFGPKMTIKVEGPPGDIGFRLPPGGTLSAVDTKANPIVLQLAEGSR